jgi:hypothetical protein
MNLKVLTVILAAWSIAGCAPNHVAPVARPLETEEQRNFERVWQASRRVLRDRYFEIDRQDRRDGRLTTLATTSSHGLEQLWRGDAATLFHKRENNVQTMLRAVHVQLIPADNPLGYDVVVAVRLARANRIEPQRTTTSQVRRGTTLLPTRLTYADLAPRARRAPTPPTGQPKKHKPLVIVPIENDRDLAAAITDDIRTRAGIPILPFEQSAQKTPLPVRTKKPADRVVDPPLIEIIPVEEKPGTLKPLLPPTTKPAPIKIDPPQEPKPLPTPTTKPTPIEIDSPQEPKPLPKPTTKPTPIKIDSPQEPKPLLPPTTKPTPIKIKPPQEPKSLLTPTTQPAPMKIDSLQEPKQLSPDE